VEENQNLPKRPNESPELPDKGDENPNASRLVWMAIHRIRNQDRRHNLVPCARNGNSNYRRDIPVQRGCILSLQEEDNHTRYRQHETGVREPEAILRTLKLALEGSEG
jgi:hypothetical protein